MLIFTQVMKTMAKTQIGLLFRIADSSNRLRSEKEDSSIMISLRSGTLFSHDILSYICLCIFGPTLLSHVRSISMYAKSLLVTCSAELLVGVVARSCDSVGGLQSDASMD